MKINIIRALLALTICLVSCGKKTEETKPIRKDVTETVFASGMLEAKDSYDLTAQTDGYLIQIEFKEGDLVKEGQVLAVIDNKQNNFNDKSSSALYEIARQNTFSNAPSLAQAKNSSHLAKQKMDLDSTLYYKYKTLVESNSVSQSDFDNSRIQYQTSKANYLNAIESYNQLKQQAEQALITNEAQKEISNIISSNNQITAVFNGKVYKKYKQKGDYVRKGDVIAAIGDANFIYAKVNVDETNIGKIKVGQEAFVQLNTNKDKTYKGKVSEIYPSFDEATQSFICKLVFLEPLDFVIVNTQLQSNIVVQTTKNALLIPRNYVDFGGFVTLKDSKEKIKIITKFSSNDWVQVLSGIDENTVLVTDNIADNKQTTSEVGEQMGPK
jgi:multidrug efflux pump subunit AcrA (membrane-fusion protein)